MIRATRILSASLLAGSALSAIPAFAQDHALDDRLAALEARFEALAAENQSLRNEVERLREDSPQPQIVASPVAEPVAETGAEAAGAPLAPITPDQPELGTVGTSSSYAYRMLDHAENVNSKPQIQLQAIADGELDQRVTISAAITGLIDQQWSNRDSKFGYLMRHPTSANQIGDTVSEAVLHSAQVALTARPTRGVTGYLELLYDPEQSFGTGTITALTRNQIQLRRGWIMIGDLERFPAYALVGKMDIPFGLNDTVSPFTNSTNWHAFAGLAYGAQLGVVAGGLHVRAMAVQGGSQFRAANMEVEGTNVPSRLNNFAVDGRYTLGLGGEGDALMLGASYLHGTAYCQGYPVFHFNPCSDNNPGVAAYGRLTYGPVLLLGEYAQTTKVWDGSSVPDPSNPLSVFDPVKTRSFTLGGRFGFGEETFAMQSREFALSAEFSKFIAGADGSPWERQTQIVLGTSWLPVPNVNFFAEAIRIDGFVPLNFLSGGNFDDGSTWSESGANSHVILTGAQIAF